MSESLPPLAGRSNPVGEHGALPPGTRFGELEILRVVGVGGFGIVYLARDHSLHREVALKEYMPGQLAYRGPDAQVSVRSEADQDTFALGLSSFVNEARLLARFDHRSLLKVYRFWEANNTAYMVMPFLQGKTLRETRDGMQSAPDELWFRQMLNPLLEALELLHGEKVYHRDIAPDNIFLPADGGQAVLLDFGAARRAIGDSTQMFTAILKPNYAPIEQYAESVSLRQGAWTDIYAMGAVMHYLLRGVPPPPATARMFEDHSELLVDLSFPGVSKVFLSAIDWALAVRPQDRPQSVLAFRAALEGRLTPPALPPRSRPIQPESANSFVTTVADPGINNRREAPSRQGGAAIEATQVVKKPNAPPERTDSELAEALKALRRGNAPRATAAAARRSPWRAAAWPLAAVGLMSVLTASAWWALKPSGSTSTVPTATQEASPQKPLNLSPAPLSQRDALPTATASGPGQVAASQTPPAPSALQGEGSNPSAARSGDRYEPLPTRPPAPVSVASPTYRNMPADQGGVPSRIVLEPRPPRVPVTPSPEVDSGRAAEVQSSKMPPMWPVAPNAGDNEKPPVPSAAAQRANPRGPQSPAEICEPLSFFKRLICLKSECGTDRFFSHPQCVRMREQEEAERQRRLQSGNR